MQLDELILLIKEEKNLKKISEEISHFHPYDIASIFDELELEERLKLYKIIDDHDLGEIFSYLDDASVYIEEMSVHQAANIINEMDSDDATDIISDVDSDIKEEILSYVDEEQREDIELLSQYDENQAGSIMINNYIEVESNLSVNKAMKKVICEAPNVSDLTTIFITDNKKLLGVINLKELIIAKAPLTVNDIMHDNFNYVSPYDDINDALNLVRDYDIYSLPVLYNGELVGIITMDDALTALVNETSDDYAKLSGLTEEEESDESIFASLKKRIPWLSILLILDFFVSMIISSFEKTIETRYVLVFFQSIILGLAGNAGTQALAVSVRKISLRELEGKKAISHLFTELKTGFSMGIILGILAFGLVAFFLVIRQDPAHLKIGFIVGLSIFVAMSFSSLFGGLIPLLFDKLHIDPAVASGPFITTLNDVLAVVIYFGIATIMIAVGFI